MALGTREVGLVESRILEQAECSRPLQLVQLLQEIRVLQAFHSTPWLDTMSFGQNQASCLEDQILRRGLLYYLEPWGWGNI